MKLLPYVHRVKLMARASAGMTEHQKAALKLAAEKLSKQEGRRVSMAEIIRRLCAMGGIK